MKLSILFVLLNIAICNSTSCSLPASADAGNDFRNKIAKGEDVYVEGLDIKDPLDFTKLARSYAVYAGNRRVQLPGSITFVKCRFRGRVDAFTTDKNRVTIATVFGRNLTFINCDFDEEVNFRAVIVPDLVSFSNCVFQKKVNFEEADFGSYATFGGSRFAAEARFQNAFFRKKADFMRVEFGQAVNFQGAAFTLDAQFSTVKSFVAADFSTVQFNGHAFFNYAEWHGRSTFDECWFKGRCEFMNGVFVNTSIQNARFFDRPRFDEAKIDTQLNLQGCVWTAGSPDWQSVDLSKVKK